MPELLTPYLESSKQELLSLDHAALFFVRAVVSQTLQNCLASKCSLLEELKPRASEATWEPNSCKTEAVALFTVQHSSAMGRSGVA